MHINRRVQATMWLGYNKQTSTPYSSLPNFFIKADSTFDTLYTLALI